MPSAMSQSPASQRRAQLIREMARDLHRTRPASRSSRRSDPMADLTNTTFDPDNEAMMSTQRLDDDNISQQLPELRNSAKKYGRYNPPEPSFVIDTSAMGRAFPDFTQAGPSSTDSSSLPVEHGRQPGNADNGKSRRPGRSRDLSLDDDEDYSKQFSPCMIGDYQVMYTPPLTRPKASKRTADNVEDSILGNRPIRRASALQKEATRPSPPIAKAADYGSGGSRQGSSEQRRTLASMHARVRDENDASYISDDRPPTLNLTTRSTRFGAASNAKTHTAAGLPPMSNPKQVFTNVLPEETVQAQNNQTLQTNSGTVSSANPGTTQQSFMLPEMPNLSELVSGFFQDGTPVFSRQGKSLASRFASGTQNQQNGAMGPGYDNVAHLLTPEEERAIILSLQLLQDKVAELEHAQAEAQANIQDLQATNQALEREKAESKRLRRSDSALGTTDGSDAGDEAFRGPRKWIIEKTRLQSAVRALQEQVDSAIKNSTVSDIAVKNVTRERDSAVTQLGVAYLTTQQLKVENEQLIEENTRLRNRIAQFLAETNGDAEASVHVEEAPTTQVQPQILAEPQSLIQTVHNHQIPAAENSRQATSSRFSRRDDSQVDGHQQSRVSTTRGNIMPQPETNSYAGIDLSGRKRIKKTRMILEEYSESEKSDDSLHESAVVQSGLPNDPLPQETTADLSRELTMLSFIQTGDVAKLRKTLESERIARKQEHGQGSKPSRLTEDVTGTAPLDITGSVREQALPRKSSMRSTTGRTSRRGDDTIHTQTEFDQTIQSNISTTSHRRHSEQSLLEVRNRRQGRGMEEMTSAFIVPDITIRNPGAAEEGASRMSAAAQQVFDNLAQHNGKNCTVCKRVIEHGSTHDHYHSGKQTIKIPKPIPVSDRMPEPTEYEEEPTIRPSQPPPVALAKVIKAVEDELAHLKMKLSRYQVLYNQHDASLSQRKRKAVMDKISSLLKAVDAKADQVYQLYDVLEGQKAAGQEMSEDEFDMTIQSIGIDLEGMGLRGGDMPEEKPKDRKRNPWDLDTSESEGELPWEGIETTIETTGASVESRRRSWGA
ncbi:hypothetical protein MMC30_002271 [Trapelia coarctata]|nr:hypothetical protein [Trapelia coarctata]